MTRALPMVAALALLACVPLAHAQVYQCSDASGRTTYADAPCASGSQKLAIPDTAKTGAGNPTVCAQLLDERHRLDVEARRNASRGRAATLDIARQRTRVVAQYRRRCAAVSR